MKLEAFRLQNYKKVQDTGWVDCGNMTVLVGKNEAGKTAILKGLSKLRSTDGGTYDGLKEFPHGRFTDEFSKQDWPVASGKYLLSEEECEHLTQISPLLGQAKAAILTKHYSNQLKVAFIPAPSPQPVGFQEYTAFLETVLENLDKYVPPTENADAWLTLKANLEKAFNNELSSATQSKADPELTRINGIDGHMATIRNEQWCVDFSQPISQQIDGFRSRIKAIAAIPEAEKWLKERLPYFLYFGDYEVLKSAIYIPEFINRVNAQDKASQTRVQEALFKHVGVDIKNLAQLGKHQPGQPENPDTRRQLDELSIKASSASQAMTRKFSDWWLQRHHRFSYRFQGDYFRIWVSDDLDPAEVEFEERSLGMQYFFSFYLLFLVEAQEQHRNCILLLDEPGIHLHGTAQQKLIEFLDKVSVGNQLIYTTHSPFMIDATHLERTRAIYETDSGTKISTDVWPRDRDSLFPLQAALGYSICQSLFISDKQLLVEGQTDYMLLQSLNEALAAKGEPHLDPGIIMLPVGGAKNMAPLASLLVGHGIQIAILMDSDKAAQISEQKIKNIMIDLDQQCLGVRQFGDSNINELEDLISQDYYIDAVRRSYPNIDISFTPDEDKIRSVVEKVSALFERKCAGKPDKRLPIYKISQDLLSASATVPPELYELGKRVFQTVNELFDKDKQKAKQTMVSVATGKE